MPEETGEGSSQAEAPQAIPDSLPLQKSVYLAYTDAAGAGSRALLTIDLIDRILSLAVPELSKLELRPAVVRELEAGSKERQFQPLELFNCKYDVEPYEGVEFSVLVVNTPIPPEKCHYVTEKIVNACVTCCVERLVVLSTFSSEALSTDPQPLYENCFNVQSVSNCDPLPESTKIADPLLNTLIQMVNVSGVPCSVFFAPTYKLPPGKAAGCMEAEKSIMAFQDVLERFFRLRFDMDLSLDLVFRGSDVNKDEMVTMMYV